MTAARQLAARGLLLLLGLWAVLPGISCSNQDLGVNGTDGTDGEGSTSAPLVTSITPALGPTFGGIPISITGQNFAGGATVSIGGAVATTVTVWSGTLMTATLPRNLGAFGPVPVVIQNPNGQRSSRSDVFTYYSSQLVFPNPMIPVASGVTALVAGDFNGDAHDDIAVAFAAANQVSVMLSNGEGGFVPSLAFFTGLNPTALVAGDFNNDRKLDLATADSGSADVSILLGDGHGQFAVTRFPTGASPAALTVGDFDGDGNLDLAVANSASDSVSVLRGNGLGRFAAAIDSPTGRKPNAVVAADFNGDGKLDLAVAYFQAGNLSILSGNGGGNFGTATDLIVGTSLTSLTVGDLNRDQTPDLVVIDNPSNAVKVVLGEGTGRFSAARTFSVGSQPLHVLVTDLDGDSWPDLLVGTTALEYLLRGDGMGGFFTPVVVGNQFGSDITPAIGDWNGDSKLDFVGSRSNLSSLLINLNGVNVGSRTVVPLQSGIRIAVGDFNDDGQHDLFYGDGVLLGNGQGGFDQKPLAFATGATALSTAIADFTADGKTDLAVISGSGVNILRGDGSGGFGPPLSIPSNTATKTHIGVGDLNADSRPDLVLSGGSPGVLFGDGAGGFMSADLPPLMYGGGGAGVAVGDFDGDKNQDIAMTQSRGIPLYLGNGKGEFTASTLFSDLGFAATLVTGDFNGDGRTDLGADGQAATLYLGAEKLGLTHVATLIPPANFAFTNGPPYTLWNAAADWNGDRNLDLLIGRNNILTVYWGDGKGGFTGSSSFFGLYHLAGPVAVADFDGDSRPDVALVDSERGLLIVPNIAP